MSFPKHIFVFCFLCCSLFANAQIDTTAIKIKELSIQEGVYNPLSPSKAAFYSAVFPGGGQIYNKKYWKAPLVWAAIGTATYFYIDNSNEYDRYRTAFKLREQGLQDEFTRDDGSIILSTASLENAQTTLRKNRDLSLLTGILLYVLQIVEASVNAHLLQFNTDDNLSIRPTFQPDKMLVEAPKVGLSLKYSF
ncbi:MULTISPECIES: DUF5683 domain-containing protein [Tenacibaculum]|uniref:DUF5683 domain-containing protein n=1 Tax=Tenacibaculum TaxID=104267 RepID=UPI001F0A6F9B|nr:MULTISPECIES: DUF5683 domain-containing protein [Tenacibaculum]MCH3882448.1 DUF5683 domain-containing protein [Tenacibaculum aquimarinum]MCH3885757.1 DUF5683 domain-containing protein [Tenacibaculum aquimarinum]MDO6600070.1 DUF5683 domain-containing protein [Tenacibaculum sp. 1_MG-2023]